MQVVSCNPKSKAAFSNERSSLTAHTVVLELVVEVDVAVEIVDVVVVSCSQKRPR